MLTLNWIRIFTFLLLLVFIQRTKTLMLNRLLITIFCHVKIKQELFQTMSKKNNSNDDDPPVLTSSDTSSSDENSDDNSDDHSDNGYQ